MDYYSILGVPRTASPEEIKKAYKKQAMKHHPDRGGDSNTFQKVQEAYEVLSNSDKRSAYDNPQPGFSFNSRDFANGHNPFAGSPFEGMFNQNFRQRTPRNKDIRLAAAIDLKDVLLGKHLIMQYKLNSGKLETVTVDIPPGAKHGDTIRFQGLGDDGHPRYPRGDLDVRIKVSKKKDWERDGNNLITKKIINVFDLLTGCAIIVTTLDEKKVQLKIPKGTKSGQIFSIGGYGVPDINTGKRGNLYVSIEADMPIIEDPKVLEDLKRIKQKVNGK
jgi:curved DNA-binding protein